MKLPIVILIVWACRSIGADTNSINIVLSPFYSDTAKATASTFVTEVLKSAPRNSRVVFTDGWGLSTIADVTIPDLKIDKPSTRATFLRQSLGKLSKWFLDVGKLEPVALSGTSAVRIPEVLKQRTGSDVVIVGSPIFQSVTEPSFSFGFAQPFGHGGNGGGDDGAVQPLQEEGEGHHQRDHHAGGNERHRPRAARNATGVNLRGRVSPPRRRRRTQ